MIRKSRTSLFLMELIISILLFSLTSAVCIQLFVNTHIKEKQAKEIQFALNEVQNISAILKKSSVKNPEDLPAEFKQIYGNDILTNIVDNSSTDASERRTYIWLIFDKDFNQCSPKDCSYLLSVTAEKNVKLLECNVELMPVNNDLKFDSNGLLDINAFASEDIYITDLKKYVPDNNTVN